MLRIQSGKDHVDACPGLSARDNIHPNPISRDSSLPTTKCIAYRAFPQTSSTSVDEGTYEVIPN